MEMVTSESGLDPQLKRRTVLATMGASALAGCNSYEQVDSPDEPNDPQSVNSQEGDCVSPSQYEELQAEYEELREQYSSLWSEVEHALVPPYIVTGQRKTSVTYETIDGEIDGWQWDSSTLVAQNTSGSIVREFTYSQLQYLGWNDFGFEGNSKYRGIGDFGPYYQLNPFVIPSNFTPLAKQFYKRHQEDRDRIREAWNFVTQLNDYVEDIGETPRFPLETLLMGGGDCEDSAILLGSILYSMPGELNPKFWYIDGENPTDPQNINHVIVSAETNNGSYLIETTSSENMLPYDSINGFSVDVNPN